jgi:hypothetical protein
MKNLPRLWLSWETFACYTISTDIILPLSIRRHKYKELFFSFKKFLSYDEIWDEGVGGRHVVENAQ